MLTRHLLTVQILLALVAAAACGREPDVRMPVVPKAPIRRIIQVAPEVSLEVLDWGGLGRSLVFLAGLGNTAHIFDTFARQFTDRFHVVGITLRGLSASASALPPASLDTLVTNLTTTLDALGLTQVALVGHSIAGEEMTRFAELHDNRCAGLIYLDAAYDRSGADTLASQQPSGSAPRIRASDTVSFTSVQALYARVMGVAEPESDIRATERFDAADRYQGSVTPNAFKARVANATPVARYDRIRCRALALYAIADSPVNVVPYYDELNATERVQAESLLIFVQRMVADSHARIARLPPFQVVDVRSSNHYLFLQHPREVAAAMRRFLGTESSPPTP